MLDTWLAPTHPGITATIGQVGACLTLECIVSNITVT